MDNVEIIKQLIKKIMTEESSFEDDLKLTEIVHEELSSNNKTNLKRAMSESTNGEAILIGEFAKHIASSKNLIDKEGKNVVSNMFAIPILSLQKPNVDSNRIDDDDLSKILDVMKRFNIIDENVYTIFLQNILSPQGVFIDSFEINQFHDSIIMKNSGINSEEVYPNINKVINEDSYFFKVNEESFVLRYIIGTFITEEDKYISNISSIQETFDMVGFDREMKEILSKYFNGKTSVIMPLPYNEGIESGIIEYNTTACLNIFSNTVSDLSLSPEILRIEVDENDDKQITIRLIDIGTNRLISIYHWQIPFLTSSTFDNIKGSIEDIAHNIGLKEYHVKASNSEKAILH